MFGGSAAFFGSVTWHDHKAVGSSASHWSGFGRRNSGRGSSAMVAPLPNRSCRLVLTSVTGCHLSRQHDLPDPADAITPLAPVEVLAVDAARGG